MSHVEFQVEANYTVSGTLIVEGFQEPSAGPDSACTRCHGSGMVVVFINPPDEFNAEPEEVCEGCDCIHDIPSAGSGGHVVFDVEEVWCCDEGDFERALTAEERERFVTRVGRDRLADLANDAAMAAEG
jgi:hypothetical protein